MEKCRSNEVLIQQYRYSSQSIQLSCGSSSLVKFLRLDLSEGLPVLAVKFVCKSRDFWWCKSRDFWWYSGVILPGKFLGELCIGFLHSLIQIYNLGVLWFGGQFQLEGCLQGTFCLLWQTQKTMYCSEGKVQSKQMDVNFKPYEGQRAKCNRQRALSLLLLPSLLSVKYSIVRWAKYFCSFIATPIHLLACNI